MYLEAELASEVEDVIPTVDPSTEEQQGLSVLEITLITSTVISALALGINIWKMVKTS